MAKEWKITCRYDRFIDRYRLEIGTNYASYHTFLWTARRKLSQVVARMALGSSYSGNGSLIEGGKLGEF